jgi:hypothetical protein
MSIFDSKYYFIYLFFEKNEGSNNLSSDYNVLIYIRSFGFCFSIRVAENLKKFFDFKVIFKENSHLPRFVVGFLFLGVTLDVGWSVKLLSQLFLLYNFF